ncbi:MAG: CsgG/HfaB family protein [Pyrinomonadaceae bacterium]
MRSICPVILGRAFASVFCALILTVCSFSQSTGKPSIAVLPFAESGTAQYGGTEVSDILIGELLSSGKFEVADKTKAAVEPDVLETIKDTIDAPTALEIGRRSGARYLIIGNLTEYVDKMKKSDFGMKSYESFLKYTLRLVDSKTGDVLLTQTFKKSGVSVQADKSMQETLVKSAKEAATALIKKLASS